MAEQSVTDAERRAPAVSAGALTVAIFAVALILLAIVVYSQNRLPEPAATSSPTPAATPTPASTSSVTRTVTEEESPDSRSTSTAAESSSTTETTSQVATTTTTTSESTTETVSTPSPDPSQTAAPSTPVAPSPTTSTSTTTTTTTTVTPTSSPTPTPTPPPTAAAGKGWDDYWSTSIAPLTGSVTFIAGGVLALFVLARLLLELPLIRDRRSSVQDRRILGATAAALVLGAPTALWWVGVQTQSKVVTFSILLPVLLVTVGLLGSIATAMWLASRMRLQVSVENASVEDAVAKVTAEDVVSALQALAAPSKGIEVPTGMALDTLSASLGNLSKTGFIAAIQGVVLFVIGVVPWQITVTQHSATEATVLISRHGRMRGSERISLTRKPYGELALFAPAPPTKPGDAGGSPPVTTTAAAQRDSTPPAPVAPATPPDATPEAPSPLPSEPAPRDVLAIVAAAVVLMELRKIETHDFDLAMMGATSPDSVALRYIASKWFTAQLQSPEGRKILDAAVTADPHNQLARWTLDWARHRDASSAAPIRAYCDRLLARLDDRAVEVGSLRRAAGDPAYTTALMTLAAIARNLAALTSAQMSAQDRTRVERARAKLRDWRTDVAPTAENRRARDRAAIDLLAIDAALRMEARTRSLAARHVVDPAVSASPQLSYSLACHLVRWCDVNFADEDVKVLLARAVENPAQKAFVAVDPELVSARDRAGFAAFRDAQQNGPPPVAPRRVRIGHSQRMRVPRGLR